MEKGILYLLLTTYFFNLEEKSRKYLLILESRGKQKDYSVRMKWEAPSLCRRELGSY